MTYRNQTREYTVQGMTCSHCVASVRKEVAEVSKVVDVDLDLESGRLVVTGDDIDEVAVRTAVEEAGYEIAA